MTFDKWFRDQFGKPPSRKSIVKLAQTVVSLDWRLAEAKVALRRQQVWNTRYDAARKAYNALSFITNRRKTK